MTNDTTPATKADIQLLMDSIGKLYDANERWKDELLTKMDGWQAEITRHFDVVIEKARDDLLGASRDQTELWKTLRDNHERRIRRLEGRCGLIVA